MAPWVPDPLRTLVVPQNASAAPVVAHWVQGPLSVDEHRRRAAGAPGLAPRVPAPLRALVAPQNASGAPVVAHWVQGPLGTGRHRLCAAGAPGLALWVPHPLCALNLSRKSFRALLAHWESDLLADPLVGSLGLLDASPTTKMIRSVLYPSLLLGADRTIGALGHPQKGWGGFLGALRVSECGTV